MEIDKLALISIEDKEVLMTRSIGKQLFYLPGGKRESGESDAQALKREVKEELEVELVDESISFLDIFKAQADGKAKGTIVKMTCYTAYYNQTPTPCNEIETIQWMNMSHYNQIAEVDKLIFNFLFEKGLIK